jgi:hypothetical protein
VRRDTTIGIGLGAFRGTECTIRLLTTLDRNSTALRGATPQRRAGIPAVLITAAVVWAAVLPAAAWASASDHAGAQRLAAPVYLLGSVICHQQPARTIVVAGAPLPVCARCTGIYGGAAVAALAAWRRRRRGGLRALPPRTAQAVLAAAALPALATLIYEWTTGAMPDHWMRAATGAVLGSAVAWVVIAFTASADAA